MSTDTLRALSFILLMALSGAVAAAPPAHDYPTQARAEYVVGCMQELGGENYDTLYKCSCSIDRIADQVSYDHFVAMETFERGRQAGGERPELIREGSMASEYRRELKQVKANAAQQCMINVSHADSR